MSIGFVSVGENDEEVHFGNGVLNTAFVIGVLAHDHSQALGGEAVHSSVADEEEKR